MLSVKKLPNGKNVLAKIENPNEAVKYANRAQADQSAMVLNASGIRAAVWQSPMSRRFFVEVEVVA